MKTILKIIFLLTLFNVFFFYGCQQQVNGPVDEQPDAADNSLIHSDKDFLQKHNGFPFKTHLELLKARIKTAKYHNIINALGDGYVDINVILPNMGHHLLKEKYLDDKFEAGKPELLVYSPHPVSGKMRLVAVEYAVPLSLSENPPKGFTGQEDKWHANEEFQLWTLHAWIWHYNPDGIFNATNPLIP